MPTASSLTQVSTLDLYQAVDFRVDERWVVAAAISGNPIVFKQNATPWFAPMDDRVVCRIGGAFKWRNPSSPSYDELINGRAVASIECDACQRSVMGRWSDH